MIDFLSLDVKWNSQLSLISLSYLIVPSLAFTPKTYLRDVTFDWDIFDFLIMIYSRINTTNQTQSKTQYHVDILIGLKKNLYYKTSVTGFLIEIPN